MIRAELLKKEINNFMSKDDIYGITQWYNEILDSDSKYIVFIVRRCYLLALIMEKFTGRRMEDSNKTVYLTDAALYLWCKELADCYRETGKFPTILICDDVLIHGRNINHYIQGLEKELCALLEEYENWIIKQALLQAIRIKVYVRADNKLLLLDRYGVKLSYIRKEKASYWHKLSYDISMLISKTDVAYASYIYTEKISGQEFEKINIEDYIETRYQNKTQFTKVNFIGKNDAVKAVATIRILKNRTQGEISYRVMPMVFLPNLDDKETNSLCDWITEKMAGTAFTQQEKNILYKLQEVNGKRTFSELLTLFLSQALLQQFNAEYGIVIEKNDKCDEIDKLARNYNLSGFIDEFDDTKSFLRKIISEQIITVDEMRSEIDKAVSLERSHFAIDTVSKDKTVEKNVKIKIVNELEQYFYDMAYEEERKAYLQKQNDDHSIAENLTRRVKSCGFVLKELLDHKSLDEAKIAVSYFLQMMDAGVLSVSSFAANYVHVVGFIQYAKAGEQSLLLYPLKEDEYMPMLYYMYQVCVRKCWKVENELKRYKAYEACELEDEKFEELLDFVKKLDDIGQSPEDWKENFRGKVQFEEETNFAISFAYMGKQLEHVKKYIEFVDER